MKFQPGDDIIVLHNSEEGKVIEIINKQMVLIEVRGVQFPAYLDQIDFPYFQRFSKAKIFEDKKPAKKYADQIPKEKNTIKQTEISGVSVSFIPKFAFDEFDDEVVEELKIYLVNKTAKAYKFLYTQQFSGNTNFELTNEVAAFKDFYLHDISFENINDSPAFYFEFSLLNKEKSKAEYFETSLKPKPKQVFQKIEKMKEKNEPFFSYVLFENYPDKTEEEKYDLPQLETKEFKIYNAREIRQNLEPARSIVDLHIEKLMSDWQRLSNFEILTIQLKEFEKWLTISIAHHQQSLIVIHGIGTGKLRDEIHDILKPKREVRYFINKYDPRFGYGATEIFFN
jgi:hypothetical protein